ARCLKEAWGSSPLGGLPPSGAAPPRCRGGALEHHQPAASARPALVVLAAAAAAVPVRPPDPLQVVELEDEEGDDPDERDVSVHASAFVIAGVERNGPFGLFGPE